MASVHTEKRNGRTLRRIQFYDKDKRRRSIRLGSISKRDADAIRVRVECLNSASISGAPLDGETSRWVSKIGCDLADKLRNAGFADYIPQAESSTLGAFIDQYIAGRTDAKPNTIRNLKNSREKLVAYFGEERDWRDIKPGDADEWRQSLVNQRLSEATVSKAVKHAKQFGRLAHRKELVDTNPFQDLKAGSERNDSRLQFIPAETIDKVIAAAPNAEWRLIIALARYGGVRTPSETLAIKWSDVDWDGGKLTVPSPKTEGHGKPYRIIPVFPELRPYLEEAFDQAADGATYVITGYRDSNANLRTQFLRILRLAGVESWPRLFHNLRASRQTELENDFPSHVVANWLGNSPTIAQRHYLTTTEDHFRRAVGQGGGATGGAMVELQSVPKAAAETGTDSQTDREELPQPLEKQGLVRSNATRNKNRRLGTRRLQAPPRGVEDTAETPENEAILEEGGARGGAIGDLDDAIDADLAMVIELWEKLSPEARAEIRERVERAVDRLSE